jgi:hypothetical protein
LQGPKPGTPVKQAKLVIKEIRNKRNNQMETKSEITSEITSIEEFIERCFLYKENDLAGHTLFFRGVNRIYPVETRHVPSIYYPAYHYIENEDIIFKDVLAQFPDEMLRQETAVEKLILMQHVGFPTRLMDISKNPLISLFFACYAEYNSDPSFNNDGVVYVFLVPNPDIAYCDSNTVSIIANLAKCPYSFSTRDTRSMSTAEFNNTDHILRLLDEIRGEKPWFRPRIKPADINTAICLHPRMNNARIVRQDGHFFVFGIDEEKGRCAKLNPNWERTPIVISKDAKKRILKQLDRLNIDEEFVYPDYAHSSLYHQRQYLKKQG